MYRKPAVAGQFYPAEKNLLEDEVRSFMSRSGALLRAIGILSPHAGYVYSGSVAGAVFARIEAADTYVILNPNHTGSGRPFALSVETWSTPLGKIDVDREIAETLLSMTGLVKIDGDAHAYEHSGEVQLPFIQVSSPGAKIVPLCVGGGDIAQLREVSSSLASAVSAAKKNVVIVASSDMTHYECREKARLKDKAAIDKLIRLDPEGLLKTVRAEHISMCGCIPAFLMLTAALELGARTAELVKYADSGEVTGDADQVVGYAGVVIS